MGVYGQGNSATIKVGPAIRRNKERRFGVPSMRDLQANPEEWWKRYQQHGIDGLVSRSRRPHHSPGTRVGPQEEQRILTLRKKRNLGARRIQSELKRLHAISLALATVHKILHKHHAKPVRTFRRKTGYLRYERPTPGDRVQMDPCKIAPGLYQFTAVDDCTRYRVLRIYKRRTAANTLDFLDGVMEEMPFPVQRIQTDRGREFFALKVQQKLKEYHIKFRPNKPGSPHLNGKVERSQKTDRTEFYATIDLARDHLDRLLAAWQHFYNWDRPHSAHHGLSPMDRYFQLSHMTPYSDEVYAHYNPTAERIQDPNYKRDLEIRRLKRCLSITQLRVLQGNLQTLFLHRFRDLVPETPRGSGGRLQCLQSTVQTRRYQR